MEIPNKNIIQLNMEDDDVKKLLADIKKGDPRCRFKFGDRMYKARMIAREELSPVGTKGTIVGAIWKTDPTAADKDAYWIAWDGFEFVTVSVGRRLENLNEPPRLNVKVKLVGKDGIVYLCTE
jgi:hypothetical protein